MISLGTDEFSSSGLTKFCENITQCVVRITGRCHVGSIEEVPLEFCPVDHLIENWDDEPLTSTLCDAFGKVPVSSRSMLRAHGCNKTESASNASEYLLRSCCD